MTPELLAEAQEVSVRDHSSIGCSTGFMVEQRNDWTALATRAALCSTTAAEFSALSENELPGLIEFLAGSPELPFEFISVHAPTKGREMSEEELVGWLRRVFDKVDAIVVHPDKIGDPSLYQELGSKLVVENMDARKPIGQTAQQLLQILDALPAARLCLDVAHVQSVDPTLEVGQEILDRFWNRLSHVHLSSLDEGGRHVTLTLEDEERFASLLDRCRDVPWILEASPRID